MGYPGKDRKSYDTPKHPWQAARMASEVELVKRYGLRNRKEVWKTHSSLKNYRELARKLLAESAKGKLAGNVKTDSDNILSRLKRYGLLKTDAGLDDILSLDVTNFLERRLQTQVHKQGLANTVKQARQFIVHGHISVGGRRVTVPGYLVSMDEELRINYYGSSPLFGEGHPSRPAQVIKGMMQETAKPEQTAGETKMEA
ncbi:ribosomal protein S4/S9 [Candidatus Methanoperedens nitroreducens]|uniref:Small ribosomal subunit protein uS4 n=1 Tax=Candidatus Methanoperedens nitratireducens TaxID=1392998 RepID=A0A062V4Z2_9EURY|nr:30S ribosomal protein S4 [Candidatus Methanoperedens nitroreducens]KCZ71688.1 ribosomal protein S4/S9 [Candidatus Methanoperedens nitroreducens]MDJ1421316.1 30S ribosomal protein S4 [Candidatus Methanoperedens sp.]